MANNETECSPSEVCLSDSDSEFLIPTPWSDESKNEKKAKRHEVDRKTGSRKQCCEEDVPLNNNIKKQGGDLVEMPNEAVEQGMNDHLPDEIDGVILQNQVAPEIGNPRACRFEGSNNNNKITTTIWTF
ncbi:hypothetical protein Tco_0261618 [Tanacetum coccineum]